MGHITRKQFLKTTAAGLGLAAAAAGKIETADVYPVPPLARKNDARRSLDFVQNERMLRYLQKGGISKVIFGGNAFLYHATMAEYTALIEWASGFTKEFAITPGMGPSYGRAMDQAPLIRRHKFASVLMLPCADPRDAAGIQAGLRDIADACGTPLSLYLKDEQNFGTEKEAGLDVVARLVDAKICHSIKYAVVRKDPGQDAYLKMLLSRVDPSRVISGIGERPAVVHLRDFKLNGFTTGSGCVAPKLSKALLEACGRKDYAKAEQIRAAFIPLEDMRDAWGPPRVLHAAVALSGVAETGPIPPFVSAISRDQAAQLQPVARTLREKDA
jgi:dihydrodipicolinate synthase/N-acetylneuraminate lyase